MDAAGYTNAHVDTGSKTIRPAGQRWNELQAAGLNAEQVIQNLYAAGDLSDAEILQVVLTAQNRQQALPLLFKVAKSRGRLQGMVDATADAALRDDVDLSMEELLVAADAAGADVLELVVIAAIEKGGTWVLSSAFLQTQVIAEAALPQYLLENGASPVDVRSALETDSNGTNTTIKPDRVSVSPAN
jgi:hypothetical protein